MSRLPSYSSYSHDHPGQYHRSVTMRYCPRDTSGRFACGAVKVKLTFSSAPSETERLYGIVTEGPIPDTWWAKRVVHLDAWVAGVPQDDHQITSCTREGVLLRVTASKAIVTKTDDTEDE